MKLLGRQFDLIPGPGWWIALTLSAILCGFRLTGAFLAPWWAVAAPIVLATVLSLIPIVVGLTNDLDRGDRRRR